MKKILIALALAAFATTASATIAGGWHDMTASGRGAYNGSLNGTCQYCHAPHLWKASNIVSTNVPLWNRNYFTPTTYSMYSTLQGHQGTAPGARSLTCLSCHDGQVNVGAVNNGNSESLKVIATRVLNGTNLQNDHPIGLLYSSATPAGEYVTPTPTAPIILAANQVECASCHEPHKSINGAGGQSFFLRDAPTTLCGRCHLK